MKKVSIIILSLILILVMASPDLLAQLPPTLPDAPDQAPIDGGLGAVALGAGAWAVRKLRQKKK